MVHRLMLNRKSILFSTFAVLGIVAATPRFLDLVVLCGRGFRSPDMATDYLKGMLWALVLGAGIFAWPAPVRDKKLLACAWAVKIVVTLGVMLMYENNYDLDAGMYFDNSHRGDFSFSSFSFAEGTENMINLARLHYLLFPDSYHAMKVTCAMLGLIGIYFFYRAGCIFLDREDPRSFQLLAYFPGILFWSSILGKDPFVFLGIAVYSFGVVGWQRRRRVGYLLFMFLGVLLATFIRQWLGIIMIIPLVVLLMVGMRGVWLRALLAACMVMSLVVCAEPFLARFRIASMSDLMETADRTTKGFVGTAGGSTQQIDVDLTSVHGVVTFLPVAAFTALFRPLPGEVMNPFGLLAGAESAILLYLLLLAVKRSRGRDLKEPLVLWAVSFLSIWALLNGIVSSTNFGVGVRYKLQVLPLLLGVLMYLARKRGSLPQLDDQSARTTER